MEKAVRQQICSRLCSFLVIFLPMILVLALVSLFLFLVSDSSPFLLTIPIALLSTIFLATLTKTRGSVDENLVQEKLHKEDLKPKPSLGDFTHTQAKHEQQAVAESDSSFASDRESSNNNGSTMGKNLDLRAQKHKQEAINTQSDSSSLVSDGETSNGSVMGKSSELDHYRDQNPGISYSLASENDDDEEEEDGLIEIDLLSSNFSGSSEEPRQKMQPKAPHDVLPEFIFNQQDLMGLLAEINEMNEDENLIEIDISMDSSSTTKCQDLRLKQEMPFSGDQCGVLSD